MRVEYKDWDCIVEQMEYDNGRIALTLSEVDTYEPIATATVHIPDRPVGENETYLSEYNVPGITETLVDAGIVTKIREEKINQWGSIVTLVKLNENVE